MELKRFIFSDKTVGRIKKKEETAISFEAGIDRIYFTAGGDIIIKDELFNRNINIVCKGSKTAVVLGPWLWVYGEGVSKAKIKIRHFVSKLPMRGMRSLL